MTERNFTVVVPGEGVSERCIEATAMSDTPRCDLLVGCVDGDARLMDPCRILELAQTLERELAAMEYRCDMAEGEVMCLDAAVERLRKVLVAVTKREATTGSEVRHLRDALRSAVAITRLKVLEVAWLRSGGSLALGKGVSVYGTYYDRDEVEAHLASSPPDDFKPKLTTDKS